MTSPFGSTPGGEWLQQSRQRLVHQTEYDKAIADFNEAIRLDSRLASAYAGRGDAWSANYEYDKAVVDYTEAIRLDPAEEAPWASRGVRLVSQEGL